MHGGRGGGDMRGEAERGWSVCLECEDRGGGW